MSAKTNRDPTPTRSFVGRDSSRRIWPDPDGRINSTLHLYAIFVGPDLHVPDAFSGIRPTPVIPAHAYTEKVRPGTGREAGLGHVGDRAPKVGPLEGTQEAKAEAGFHVAITTISLAATCEEGCRIGRIVRFSLFKFPINDFVT